MFVLRINRSRSGILQERSKKERERISQELAS
jgi:hypothetical protein